MTCSARLPVYALVIAAFLPEKPLLGPLLGTRAAAMIGLYLLGFAAALATARLLKSTLLKRESPLPFILELPPYRWPTLQSIVLRLVDRSLIFLKRAGTVILLVAVVLWFLASVPRTDGQAPEVSDSLAGKIGQAVEPVIEPLGFNWKIGIGLITSLAAREVIVGTLGDHLRNRGRRGRVSGLAEGPEAGPDPGWSGRPADLFRLCPPVHVHGGRGPKGDRRLVAGHFCNSPTCWLWPISAPGWARPWSISGFELLPAGRASGRQAMKGKKGIHEGIRGGSTKRKKRYPRRATKNGEGPLRGWRRLKRDPPRGTKRQKD